MKKTYAILIAALGSLLFGTTACNTETEMPDRPREVVIDMSKTTSAKCEVGSQIVLLIKGNPTTGYEWTVGDFDPDFLTFGGSSYVNNKIDLKLGETGMYKFFFRVKKLGKTKGKLIYARSWELARGAKPADSEVFEIEVLTKAELE